MKIMYCTAILLLSIVASGCSAGGSYFKEISSNDREKISVINLSFEHHKLPEEHPLTYKIVESAYGTQKTPIGVSRNWYPKIYSIVLTKTIQLLNDKLSLYFPDDSFVVGIFEELATRNDNISIVQIDSTASPQKLERIDTRMVSSIWHKVDASDPFEPETYFGMRVKLYNSDDSLIYGRTLFSEHWTVTDELFEEKYKSLVENDVNRFAQIFWANITGESEP